jgi:hypothetical protein
VLAQCDRRAGFVAEQCLQDNGGKQQEDMVDCDMSLQVEHLVAVERHPGGLCLVTAQKGKLCTQGLNIRKICYSLGDDK